MEDSISDPRIQDPTGSESCAITFQLVDAGTQRAKTKLVHSDGYSYNVKLRRANAIYWQCTVRPKGNQCKAIVIKRGNDLQQGSQSHNHQPTTGAAAASKIMASVKEKAVADPFKPASAIVNEVSQYLSTVSNLFKALWLLFSKIMLSLFNMQFQCKLPICATHYYDSRVSC